ncbi:MAG: ATP-binding protein [Bacteroidales bacterium]|nr:ATP-binding protein [Bacteroidales bacterium]
MKFYDREKETATLQKVEWLSQDNAQMTVITGRRRTGKTTLIKHALCNIPLVYFFVSKKSEKLLCDELVETVAEVLKVDLGEFVSMSKLFKALMKLSQTRNFSLVFDEFQTFYSINSSVFSEMQNVWDEYKDNSKINLVFCGSIFTLMTRIFSNRTEPLYGRATCKFTLKPFSTKTLKEILKDHNPDYQPDDLLTFYMITGGVAKYVEQLINQNALTQVEMINRVFQFGSYFIKEGRDMLEDEFGKDYGKYFSILGAIAEGNTTRSQINNYVEFETGGYLDKLENVYSLISRMRPVGADENTRNVRYYINDNFLTFWFRFIYKYRSAVEIDNYDYVIRKVQSDYQMFSGYYLEKYFRSQYQETGLYNTVSNSWSSNGENEIDLVAINDIDKEIKIAEIKRNPQRASIQKLIEKSESLLKKFKKLKAEYLILSLENM